MTNELEKQFFNTFNIEPIGCNDNKNCTGALDCTQCPNAKYPQITDTHYLQLLCLLVKGMNTVTFFKNQDINDIKYSIVYGFILGEEYFTKQQVQELFEEG